MTNQTAPPVLVAANGGNLMQRITKILQKNTGRKRVNSAWSAMLALALLSAVLLTVFSFNTGSFVNAQTKMKNKKIAVGFRFDSGELRFCQFTGKYEFSGTKRKLNRIFRTRR